MYSKFFNCFMFMTDLISKLCLKFAIFYYKLSVILFDFQKTNKEISTTRGEIMSLFFQDFILQTKTLVNLVRKIKS